MAKLVKCDPKTMWSWLRRAGIEIRPRGSDPASRKGVINLSANHAFGHKLSRATKNKIRNARLREGRLPCMIGGSHWLHVYGRECHPRWQGGITADRQKHQASREWRSVAEEVWKRDKAKCRRCRKLHEGSEPFDIHHIVSFRCKSLRCELSNLVLLCEKCHYWVHGPKNTRHRFIKAEPQPKKGGT